MNMTDESRPANPPFIKKSTSSILAPFYLQLVSRCAYIAVIAVVWMFWGAGKCLAQDQPRFVWIAGNGTWDNPANWATNLYDYFNTNTTLDSGCRSTNWVNEVLSNVTASCGPGGTGDYPHDVFQGALFTNAATYTVTYDGSPFYGSNLFQNASNTAASVTLDLNGNQPTVQDALALGTSGGSTTTVTIVDSSGSHNGKLILNASINVGRNGFGTLYLNSGTIDDGSGSINLGSGNNGRGVAVFSGQYAHLDPNSQISVGNDPQEDPAGSLMIITNGARVYCSSSFRLGSGSGKGGSSNNMIVVAEGGILSCDSGPESIGLRSTGVTNTDGGTLCFNNVMLVKSGALWACANTSTKSVCVGDAAYFGLSQTQTTTPPAICTGNVIEIMAGGVVTGASDLYIAPSNSVELLGGRLEAVTISNWGNLIAYGMDVGEDRIFAGGMLKTLNSRGKLTISNGLWMVTNSVLEVELSTNQTYAATEVDFGDYTKQGHYRGGTNRFTVDQAILNIVDAGGFDTKSTWDLFTYSTNVPPGGWGSWAGDATNALGVTNFTGFVIGSTPNSSYTYSISTMMYGHIQLIIGGITQFKVVSVARQAGASTNVVVTWTDAVGKTNVLQTTTGLGNGNYSTNNFTDLSGLIITPSSTTNSYVHTNAAPAGTATRYYRVREPQ